VADIASAMGILKSTPRIIRKQPEEIKEGCKSAVRMMASKITQIKESVMEKLERMLAQWIVHQCQCDIPLSTVTIQAKGRSLFENLNAI
jgi:hypothetical protein